jgi:hypothetical protein
LKSIICHYCGKASHIERDCQKKQYDLRNKNKRNYVNANSTYVEDEDEDNNDPFIQAFVSLTQQYQHATNLWLFDIGATHHLTHNRTLLHDYSSLSTPLEVKFGDNGTKLAIGMGIVHLPINKHKIVSISNVYYVLSLARNLLSVGEATKNGAFIEFNRNFSAIKYNLPSGEIAIMTCPKVRSLSTTN